MASRNFYSNMWPKGMDQVTSLTSLMAVVRKHRMKNAGGFKRKENRPKVPRGEPKPAKPPKLSVDLENYDFPNEHAYLLKLERLDASTLRNYTNLWELIQSQPTTCEELIAKTVSLICLGWAQQLLKTREPLLKNATLICDEVRPLDKYHNKFWVNLRLTFSDVQNPINFNSRLRRNASLTLSIPNFPTVRVENVNNSNVFLKMIHTGNIDPLMSTIASNPRVNVHETQTDFIPKAKVRSIERLKQGQLSHVLLPNPEFERSHEDIMRDVELVVPSMQQFTGLNYQQALVCYSICSSVHINYPYVLHGPPGTGKTRVIATTVRCLLEMDPRVRVLLVAPSNMAADILALKLMELFEPGIMDASNVLRFRSTTSDSLRRDNRLDPITPIDVFTHAYEIPTKKDLKEKRVVISTLGFTAILIILNLKPFFFSHIFLDEAGQASESEIWIPIGGLATNKTALIFCGDPKQLGEISLLELSNEVTSRFGTPLMRYMNMLPYQSDVRLCSQLTHSYRCHPAILEIASRLFYNNSLVSSSPPQNEQFSNWNMLPKKGFPIIFVDVAGNEICATRTNSYGNEYEVNATLHYIRKLLDDLNVDPCDIGVVSPYRYQTHLLTNALATSNILDNHKIVVDSVERFQGSERKIIVISTTRTTDLGFVGCNLRMNTSITRAKHLLIVIGNRIALSRHSSWREFIRYCDQNNASVRFGHKHNNTSPPRSSNNSQTNDAVSQLKIAS